MEMTIRPLEERDLAEAAAIEATAPDAWSESALRGSLQAQREGGAARLFAAQWRPAAANDRANDTGTVLLVGSEANDKRTVPCVGSGQNCPAPVSGQRTDASKTKEPSPCPPSCPPCPKPFLVGVAAFQCAGGAASLDTLTVAPAFRRQGVGRALLRAAFAQLCSEGAVFCFLEVRESNAPAIALYQSLGFAAVGRRRGFYQTPAEDALVMRCMLPGASE